MSENAEKWAYSRYLKHRYGRERACQSLGWFVHLSFNRLLTRQPSTSQLCGVLSNQNTLANSLPLRRTGCRIRSSSSSRTSDFNFDGLVLVCMSSYDSESRLIFQHFSRSTRSTFLCTSPISKLSKILSRIFANFQQFSMRKRQNFAVFVAILAETSSKFVGISQII